MEELEIKKRVKYETRIPFFLVNRHLWKGNKWTLFLTVFLMAVAFVNLIFVSSLFAGIIDSTNRQIIDTSVGHILILPSTGEDVINDVSSSLEKIKNIEAVKAVTSEMVVPATLEYNSIKGNWQILAVNPSFEKEVTVVSQSMTAGSYLEENDTDQIIIGRQIAGGEEVEMDAFSFKNAAVGDKVSLLFNGFEKEFTIKGIFYTKFIDADQLAFITQKSLEEINPEFKNKASRILVRINNVGEEKEIIDQIKASGVEGNFYSWEEAGGLMKAISKSFSSINFILSFVAALIAAITIFIVIYIDVNAKKQQVGILRAIGIRPYLINTMYVIQTVVYSVAGIALGSIIFFGGIVPYFKAFPFQLPIGDVVMFFDYADFIIRFEIFIAVAIVAGLIPAIFVTRMSLLKSIWGK